MTTPAAAAFDYFIASVRKVWAAETDTQKRMEATQPLLRNLVSNPLLQEASRSWPSTEGRKNLLLHTDEDFGFVVNAVVREPNRKGSVHDHSNAWVLYGLLDGTESLERYDRLDDGSRPDYAEVRLASVSQGQPGTVDLVPPFNVHAEQGGPGRSVAVILRSEVLVGRILQHGYDPVTNAVIKRSGPQQIPFQVS